MDTGSNVRTYHLVDCIATGVNSSVFRAVDRRTGGTVAIKRMIQASAEAALLPHLRHPALPAVADSFVEDASNWLVMAYVPGDDLATQLERRTQPFPIHTVLGWADRLLDALAYLHTHMPPVVHCDIKPRNLKVDVQGQIFLLDFGIARRAGADSAGYTLAYCAPEQLTASPIDPRTDLYALAATLYDLLTHVKPPTALVRLAAVREGNADPLLPAAAWNPAIPSALDAVLRRGLALDPAMRFTAANAMRAALQACIIQSPDDNQRTGGQTLIGQDRLIGEMRRHLLRPDVRLVTLTGPGGVGKSSIAQAIAAQMHTHFPAGVAWIDLADVTTSHELTTVLHRALHASSPDTTGVALPANRRMLLILDTFEHQAATAKELSTWLDDHPGTTLLVTSRTALHVGGEQLLAVSPLPTPDSQDELDLETARQSPAVQLFTLSAQAMDAGFQLTAANVAAVVKLCADLDGIPLAIALAAQRVGTMPLEQVGEQMYAELRAATPDSLPAWHRHTSLAASIAWSFNLLPAAAQQLFTEMAVFCGGVTADAVDAVCTHADVRVAQSAESSNAARLQCLVDHNLLQVRRHETPPRYTLFNTVRQFAWQRLSMLGSMDTIRQRHAEHFAALAAVPDTHVAPDEARLTRLTAEHDNLLAALQWTIERRAATMALRLAAALWRFWEIRSEYRLGLDWLERSLALADPTERALRAQVLAGAGALARNLSHYADAHRYFAEAYARYHETEDLTGMAKMLNSLGTVAYYQDDAAIAVGYFEESLALHRVLGDPRGMAGALNNLALLAEGMGDYTHAAQLHEEAFALFVLLGDALSCAYSLGNLGVLAEHSGDLIKAATLYQQSLDTHVAVGEKWGMAAMLTNLGSTLDRLRQHDRAAALLIEGLHLFEEVGDRAGMAQALAALARNAANRAEFNAAVHFLAAAETLELDVGYTLPAVERGERQTLLMTLHTVVPPHILASIWGAVSTTPPAQLLHHLPLTQ